MMINQTVQETNRCVIFITQFMCDIFMLVGGGGGGGGGGERREGEKERGGVERCREEEN